ncbi:MAG TPA: hypothetical protein VHP11_03735 [Tepidisphaeraceae bacterium]|nr:hypothetical protein [Tepidisphaeraceae bacterium]
MIRLCPILLLAALVGCAQYEFDLSEPSDLAQHIGSKEPTTFAREPLRYQLQAYESRLVLIVRNPTDSAVEFLGDQSYAVDPNGQSHPFPNQTIATDSFIKLILPPLRPAYGTEPGFGVGIGFSYSSLDPNAPHAVYPWPAPYDGQPLYLSAINPNLYYWTWDKPTPVRVRLTYRQDGKTFHDDFVFHRVKV